MSALNGSLEIDKEELYGEFMRSRRQDRALMLKAAHKALDIPEDEDMRIEANKTTGMSAGGVAVIAAAAGFCPALLGGAMLWNMSQPIAETVKAKVVEKVLTRDADVSVGDVTVESLQEKF